MIQYHVHSDLFTLFNQLSADKRLNTAFKDLLPPSILHILMHCSGYNASTLIGTTAEATDSKKATNCKKIHHFLTKSTIFSEPVRAGGLLGPLFLELVPFYPFEMKPVLSGSVRFHEPNRLMRGEPRLEPIRSNLAVLATNDHPH